MRIVKTNYLKTLYLFPLEKNQAYTANDIIDYLKGKKEVLKLPTIFEYGYKLVDRQKQVGKIGNARVSVCSFYCECLTI